VRASERARFFRDTRFLGTAATLLKKFGEMLAGYILKVALGATLPSSAGVERFGVIAEFAKRRALHQLLVEKFKNCWVFF
jgi:hypothetical protein